MIALDNQTQSKLNEKLLEGIAQHLDSRDVELLLIDSEEMQNLNRTYRDKDSVTDVLSFPLDDVAGELLGSIVICAPVASEAADVYGHGFEDEVALLFVHGMLHLLGFDHEVDEDEMRIKEAEIIQLFKLPKSLILRSEGGH